MARISRLSRFDCASSSLTLRDLLRKAQCVLWGCFALGIAMHLSLMQIGRSKAEYEVAKPLTTQFVKRQPRLTKPLELKKRPQPKRRSVQRKMVSVKARMQRDQVGVRLYPMQVLRKLATPSSEIKRDAVFARMDLDPKAVARRVEGHREVVQKIDMSLELLDIEILDTGRYHALVVQDTEDKRSVRGFCRLGLMYSESVYGKVYPNFDSHIMPALVRLVDSMNRYTEIRTDFFGRISLGDAELFKTPWVYIMAYYGFELSDSELRGLGSYLTSGGFVFADTYWNHPQWNGGFRGIVTSLTEALELQGIEEARFEALPNGHPIYHCYFDFDGPPAGADVINGTKYQTDIVDYLEGIEIDGRLCVTLSKKTYNNAWGFWGTERQGGAFQHLDPERCLRFGVNLIVFALTQEGSITHRLMESIK